MTTGLQIDQKIRKGYAKAAVKLGRPFNLYRSSSSIDPINSGNLIGSLNVDNTQSWDWMKGNRPGNAIWYLLVDGQDSSAPLSAEEGDFLVGEKTFFVLSKEFQMPMQGVECNAIIKVSRPFQSTNPGGQGYAGYLPQTSTMLMQGMPASVLIQGRGRQAKSNLPTDTTQPNWIILIANLGDVDVKTGDIITDATNQDYILSATEQTEFGWRCTAMQVVNG